MLFTINHLGERSGKMEYDGLSDLYDRCRNNDASNRLNVTVIHWFGSFSADSSITSDQKHIASAAVHRIFPSRDRSNHRSLARPAHSDNQIRG